MPRNRSAWEEINISSGDFLDGVSDGVSGGVLDGVVDGLLDGVLDGVLINHFSGEFSRCLPSLLRYQV